MSAEVELPPDAEDAPPIVNELDEAVMLGRDITPAILDYVPADVREAEYAARRIAVLQARANEIDQQYAVWRARIDGWRADELARITPARDVFTGWLEAFGRRARELEPNRATFTLPSASIATRQQKEPSVVVDLEEEVIEWARGALSSVAYEKVIKTKESVLISELRKIIEIVPQTDDDSGEIVGWHVLDPRTGAIVPGVVVVPPTTTAKVTLNS